MRTHWQPQSMSGVFLLEPFRQSDDRGDFVKTLHAPTYQIGELSFELREEFFSVSHKNVLRGMHLQREPHAHQKIVYCVNGSVLDVLVDLRRDEPTFGKTLAFELNEENRHVLWIGPGIAHGFLSLRDNSCVIYKTDREHFPESDTGVLWNSIDFHWPVSDPIVSPRDQSLVPVERYLDLATQTNG